MSEIPGPSPEQMNVEASLPPKTEVSGFDAPAEALGLQNMNFTVRRNIYDGNGNKQDGFTEETGWFVQSTHEIQDEEGNPIMVARIRKNAPDPGQTQPGTPYKDILASELQSWQHNEDEADIETVPRQELNRLKSTMGAGRQDIEDSSSVEEAKKYWYSPEEAAAIDKSKYSQHNESQDPAEQWWNKEQAQESKELEANPEISKEVAEEVGEVAVPQVVDSSFIDGDPRLGGAGERITTGTSIESAKPNSQDALGNAQEKQTTKLNPDEVIDGDPRSAAVAEINSDSISEARAKVQEVFKKSDHEASEVNSSTETENSTKEDLKLNHKQLDMLQSITQDIQRMSENGAPQSELDYQVGGMVNSVLIETKRLAEEGKPEPGLELAVLSLEFGAASHSDRAFNEIAKTLGKDERRMFGMFANQLDGLKRQGIKDPAEVTYHLQKQIRNALDAVEKESSEFDKDKMRMVIMGTALGAAVEFKHKQAIFAELESTFSKQGH